MIYVLQSLRAAMKQTNVYMCPGIKPLNVLICGDCELAA